MDKAINRWTTTKPMRWYVYLLLRDNTRLNRETGKRGSRLSEYDLFQKKGYHQKVWMHSLALDCFVGKCNCVGVLDYMEELLKYHCLYKTSIYEPTLWHLLNVSIQITLRNPRKLIRADTFRIRGIEI